MRLIIAVTVAASIACTPANLPKETLGDPLARLDKLVEGGHELCEKDSECASGLCDTGNCAGLVDSSNGWMERRVAGKLHELLKAHPEVSDKLSHDLIPKLMERDVVIRVRLAGVLGRLGDQRFVPTLEKLAASHLEVESVKATLALGWLGSHKHYRSVKQLLLHRSDAVTLSATDGILTYLNSEQHQQNALKTLTALLAHSDHRVRRKVIRGLGADLKGNKALIEALKRTVQTEGDEFLRYDAIQALAALGTAPDPVQKKPSE